MSHFQPLVTVIIPVFNEADFIQPCLDAILNQDYPAQNLEILVIDGGSTDATRRIVQTQYPGLHLLDNPLKIQAAALNIGIKAAKGQIIIRVDGHTLIAPDYVSACVSSLLADSIDNVGGLMNARGATYTGQAIALATSSPFGIGGSKFHYSNNAQFVDTVYLGAYYRQTLLNIGLYDESLAINEDYELNYRLRQAGGKILLNPKIKSTYIPRSSLVALWQQYFKYGCWKIRTLQKHPASLQWRQAVAPLFVAALLGSLLLSLVWTPMLWLFIVTLTSYLLAVLLASTIAARHCGWKYLPLLPVVFAFIHFAWGLGFWYGLLTQIFKQNKL